MEQPRPHLPVCSSASEIQSGCDSAAALCCGRGFGQVRLQQPALKLVDCFFSGGSRLSERIRLSAVFVVAAVLAASAIALKQDKAQAPHGAPAVLSPAKASTKKAEEQFKNIQVLKGIPADQLIPTMQFISASLGVECEFCHEPKAFDKDDKKPKQTARKMMEMMFAINKDNFEGHREVTCYSCHRGNAHPQAIPAVATEQAPAAQPQHGEADATQIDAKENSGPTTDQLLDKYVNALGGSSAV